MVDERRRKVGSARGGPEFRERELEELVAESVVMDCHDEPGVSVPRRESRISGVEAALLVYSSPLLRIDGHVVPLPLFHDEGRATDPPTARARDARDAAALGRRGRVLDAIAPRGSAEPAAR